MSASSVAGECLTCGGPRELQCNGVAEDDRGLLFAHGWIRCWRNDEPGNMCGNADRTRVICPRCEPEKRQARFAEVSPP